MKLIERIRGRAAHVVRGDRPLAAALVGVLVLGAVVLSGPAQSYLDGRERVELLAAKAAALDDANAQLERRAEDLTDPGRIELLAREKQGFIRPGEVAYALAPPEVERPRITAARDRPATESDAWYHRAWRAATAWTAS